MHPESFVQFIEFGNIFDRPTRVYLVEYLKQKAQIENKLPQLHLPNGASNEWTYFKNALDKVFENQTLLKATGQYPKMAHQAIEEILKWIRDTHQKIQTHDPYKEEVEEFRRWEGKPAFLWIKSWYHLTVYLKENYTKQALDISFYEQKFEHLLRNIYTENLKELQIKHAQQLTDLEILIEDLLSQWKALLTAKRLAYELAEIDKQREVFCELLYAKVEEFIKLLQIISPFAEEAGRFWDMSSGKWHNTGFEILERYAQILHNEKSIQELADLLGRLREAKIETQEEIYEKQISRKAWIDDLEKKDEIGGITTSDYLPNVLPSEMVYMDVPETEYYFWRKYLEKDLMSYQYQGKKLINNSKIEQVYYQKIKRKERGPFIICVDTSGSMEGLPEQIAKTLCFAILKMASEQKRKAFLINFSVGIKTINLLDLADSMEELIHFLSMSFHGGTDAAPALAEAITMLQTNDYKEADVLMVSDFIMFEIREDILKKIRKEQAKDTRFHSLTISSLSNPQIIEVFDNQWTYDPHSREVIKQAYKDLQVI